MTLPDGGKGIKVLPPDVNISDKDFTPVYVDARSGRREEEEGRGKRGRDPLRADGGARRGREGGRGDHRGAARRRAVHQPVRLLRARGPAARCTRATIEALIKCGAFSSHGRKRPQLLQVLDAAVEMGQQSQNDKRSGQMNMFGGGRGVRRRRDAERLARCRTWTNCPTPSC